MLLRVGPNLTSVVENDLLKLGDQNRNEKLQNFSAKRHSERKTYLRRVTRFMFCYGFFLKKPQTYPNPEQLIGQVLQIPQMSGPKMMLFPGS